MPERRKILIIRGGPLKLFIQSIPAQSAIRKFHAKDEVYILTEKHLIGFCKRTKFFDKVWLDTKPEWFQVHLIKDLSKRLRSAHFDMVYDLQNDKRSMWYFRLFGLKKPRWNSSVTTWCSDPYKVTNANMHFQDILFNQIKVAGIKSAPLIDISYIGTDELDGLPEKFVMICAAGDREKPAHKLDPLKYSEIIDIIHEKFGLPCILVGSTADDNVINSVIADSCVKAKPVNYTTKTSVSSIISLAKKSEFCLGNETAPTHIAAYSGVKTIMFCSRFSPPELITPRVSNLAIIEEPALENVETSRILKAIEEFGMVKGEQKFGAFKVAGGEKLSNS